MFKPLKHIRIERVVSRREIDVFPRNMEMRAMDMDSLAYTNGKVPDGCFVANARGIHFPRRKRGEKFHVFYSTSVEL